MSLFWHGSVFYHRFFLGVGLVASRGSWVNFSYCDHAVVRNLESKSIARLLRAKARSLEGKPPRELHGPALLFAIGYYYEFLSRQRPENCF